MCQLFFRIVALAPEDVFGITAGSNRNRYMLSFCRGYTFLKKFRNFHHVFIVKSEIFDSKYANCKHQANFHDRWDTVGLNGGGAQE